MGAHGQYVRTRRVQHLGDQDSELSVAENQTIAAALDILQTNAEQGWTRPIYFAVTVSPDGQLDLQNYFQLEGQAFRVVPIKHDEPLGRVVPSLTPERLKRFKFTNLDNPDVYYDENIRRMVDNYRNIFAQTAIRLSELGQTDEAIALLDSLMDNVPFETIPGDERSFLFMARAYQTAGAKDRVVDTMKRAESLVLHRLDHARSQSEEDYITDFVQMIRFTYLDARDFEAAAAFENRLSEMLGDSTQQTPEELRREFEGFQEDTPDSTAITAPQGG